MSNNYIVTIQDHGDASIVYVVRILGACNEDEAKVKAFAWLFKCPEEDIYLDDGFTADHTIDVIVEEDIPTVC